MPSDAMAVEIRPATPADAEERLTGTAAPPARSRRLPHEVLATPNSARPPLLQRQKSKEQGTSAMDLAARSGLYPRDKEADMSKATTLEGTSQQRHTNARRRRTGIRRRSGRRDQDAGAAGGSPALREDEVNGMQAHDRPAHGDRHAHGDFSLNRSAFQATTHYRLLELAVRARRTTYETIVWSRRGLASMVRGRSRARLR